MSVALAFGATVLLAGSGATPVTPVPSFSVARDTTAAEYFALARVQLRAGKSGEGLATYLRGAAHGHSADDRDLYSRDIAWLATRSELAIWRNAESGPRVEFLRSFWTSRDDAVGKAPGERLAEHVRRIDASVATFRIEPKRGRPPVMRVSNGAVAPWPLTRGLRDFLPTQGELDDRGVIFIRHGEPAARTVSASLGTESWTYVRDGEAFTVHFMDTMFDGASGNGTLIAVPPSGLFGPLCQADASYCALAARPGPLPPEQAERIRQHALAAIRELTTTDS